MAKKQETLFKEKVAKDLLSLGSKCYFVKIQQVTRRGTPDFLIGIRGRFVAIELKNSPKAYISPLQKYEIERIAQADNLAYFADPSNWDEIFEALKTLSECDPLPEMIDIH